MSKPIFNKKWSLTQEIGEGNTSRVYKVKHLVTGQVAALKILKTKHMQKANAKSDFQ